MAETAALYMGHLNPLSTAHEAIISNLVERYNVYVLPVKFLKGETEVNTRSFPFSFETRKEMIESVFGSSVRVLPFYCFHSPFQDYLPPILSSKSWQLRNEIVSKINEDRFVSYSGDFAERLMLRVYGFHPLRGRRLPLSASSIKEMLYENARNNGDGKWRSLVPEKVVSIIERNWTTVEKFAQATDDTKRVMGMKFPLDGYARQRE